MTDSSFPPPFSAVLDHPLVLCILDGWGENPYNDPSDAILRAQTPHWNDLIKRGIKTSLEASGGVVGLPPGQMGNSEVGHLTIGSGRVILQDLSKINKSIQERNFVKNGALKSFIEKLQKNQKACHLIGLFSPGGVHAHSDHLKALSEVLSAQGIPLYLHLILDGRDTPPLSALGYVQDFFNSLDTKTSVFVRVATVSGRFYAMDRDQRWDRVEKAFKAIAYGEGPKGSSPEAVIKEAYHDKISDEFIIPTVIKEYSGIQEGEGILCFNFRADRVREILDALLDPDFKAFKRSSPLKISCALGMTEYAPNLKDLMMVLFPSLSQDQVLGDVLSNAHLTQLRLAETEKYAHVTFFFNAGREDPFKGEFRCLIPSPKVTTYNLKPEMSAFEITDILTQSLTERRFDVYIVNFANADMVGHTGDLSAGIKAVEALDLCFGKIIKTLEATQSILVMTADHGNIEQMQDHVTHTPLTSHTSFKVPCVLFNAPSCEHIQGLRSGGTLADIAPTLLDLLHYPIPQAMTGHSLLLRKEER